MSFDLKVRGAEQLDALGRRLKATGNGGLRRELLRGLRSAARPFIPAARESARSTLPSRNGLAELIAESKMGVRSRLTGASAGVRVVATGPHAIAAINRGRLRHPVYGDRETWVTQQVRPGWFTDPAQRKRPSITADVRKVMREVGRKIAR